MKTNLRCMAGLLLISIVACTALAYDYPFSSEAIRDAYFLARENADRHAEFLQPYQHNLPMPASGAYVDLVRIQTPFTFLVDEIAAKSLDFTSYHAQEAEQEFVGKKEPFRVHVEIQFTPTYPKPTDTAETLGEFWNDFRVHLKQKNEAQPLKTVGRPFLTVPDGGLATVSGYTGAEIDVDYDPKKLDPGSPAIIEVDTPDGQEVETTFDLANLH